MNPIVVAAIVNGKGTTHVQGVKLIIDDHTVIKINEMSLDPMAEMKGSVLNTDLSLQAPLKAPIHG